MKAKSIAKFENWYAQTVLSGCVDWNGRQTSCDCMRTLSMKFDRERAVKVAIETFSLPRKERAERIRKALDKVITRLDIATTAELKGAIFPFPGLPNMDICQFALGSFYGFHRRWWKKISQEALTKENTPSSHGLCGKPANNKMLPLLGSDTNALKMMDLFNLFIEVEKTHSEEASFTTREPEPVAPLPGGIWTELFLHFSKKQDYDEASLPFSAFEAFRKSVFHDASPHKAVQYLAQVRCE